MRRRLILFAKRPVPGHVKTRLTPPLSPDEATALYRALLADTFALMGGLAAEVELEVALDGPWRFGADEEPPSTARVRLQGSGDLGDRLGRAFSRSVADGVDATVAIGADAPHLDPTLVRQTFEALRRTDAALVPADDGGYLALGVRRAFAPLLIDIPWGGEAVLDTTRRAAEAAGLSLATVGEGFDIDDIDALSRLRASSEALRRAPRTSRWLAAADLAGRP